MRGLNNFNNDHSSMTISLSQTVFCDREMSSEIFIVNDDYLAQ